MKGQLLGLKKCATRGEGDVLAHGIALVRELCGTIHAVRVVTRACVCVYVCVCVCVCVRECARERERDMYKSI